MKKIILMFVAAMTATVMMAQTNFRHISFEEAKAAAKAEKKMVFVDFYTSWCGPCKMMARDVFPQKELGDYMNKTFVCVKYDAEKEEKELVGRSKVTAYPTFVIFDAEGNEVTRLVGGNSAEGFKSDIEMKINPDKSPEKIKARYDGGERTAALISTYAAQLTNEIRSKRRGDKEKEEQLNKIIKEYYSGLDDKQKLKSENFFLYKDYVDNTADEKMQYLFTNRSKVAKADRADVDSILLKKYKRQIYDCIYFDDVYTPEQAVTFKQQFNELGLNADGVFTPSFAVLDAYATGNMEEYLKQLEKNLPKMEKQIQNNALLGIGNALQNADSEVKKKAAKYLRGLLAEQPAGNIYFLGMIIGDLEGTMGH
ncbi:MAG: thioredoxin family protein [Prevotella sp.]|nr:thioredoxin family protein [Prevotella sp.]